MLKRVFKMLMAQGANVGVALVGQMLLPPVFLHSFGVPRYGEWLVLSATISYLATLNFGVTTYASNELTILRQRGSVGEYRRLQSSTQALILSLVVLGAIISAGIAVLPLPRLLHLKLVSPNEAAWTTFFLGLQMASHILGGYYNNLFMVIQKTHRGTMWWNLRLLASTLTAAVLAFLHCHFSTIASGQFIATLAVAMFTLCDLRLNMPDLPLGLRGANWTTVKSSLKPSGMFAMIYVQSLLTFQAPVILLQWLVGPEVVVLFTISRTVLSGARQLLSVLTNAIAPEITLSFGSGDLAKLLDIFHYSERVVFSLIPVANLGTFLSAPFLIRVWLHKPDLFEPWTYALMALISGVMSMREHKQFFQFSTNTHHRLAHIVFWGNLLMLAVSVPMTLWLGLRGFMITWLVSESTQMALLYFENRKLFHSDSSISMVPVLKLGLLMGLALPVCMVVVTFSRQHGQALQAGIAVVGAAVIFGICYWLFGLNVVQKRLTSRFSNRPASVALANADASGRQAGR